MSRAHLTEAEPPNLRLKLSGRGGHFGRNWFFLTVAAPARSLSAIR